MVRNAFSAPLGCVLGAFLRPGLREKRPMANLVELHSVSYTYEIPGGRSIPAVRGVDLAIEPGEFVGLIGANGSGKTTLVRLINGILIPTRGKVLVNGIDTRQKARLQEIRRTAAMVFQSPRDQIVGSTVEEDTAFGPENLGVPQEEIVRRVESALKKVGVWDLRARPPFQLSAGQAQRVAIAGAMAMSPKILILDEATSMLDPAGRKSVLEIARKLNQEGIAILLVTHFMEEAALADRLIVMHQGKIVSEGSPKEIFSDRGRLLRWGLDVPPITRIAHRLHEVDRRIARDALTVDALAESAAKVLAVRPIRPAPILGEAGDRPERTAFLRAEEVWHVYMAGTPLETVALKGVDFSVPRGGSMGLMGGTGSGKSTLMQHLNGLLSPQRGRILVDGMDIQQMRDQITSIRRSVVMVFQQPEDQVFARFVGDDVAYGLRQLGLPREELRQRVREAMEAVGLDFDLYKDRFTYTLSGGERRRVALAGALALNPKALLLDEPTAGLDPASHKELLQRLSRWKKGKGLTLAYSSHTMEDLAEMTEDVVVMDSGRVAMKASTREAFGRPEMLESLGLDVPVVSRLASALRDRGIPLPRGILTAGELVHALESAIRRPAAPSTRRFANSPVC